MSAFTPARVGQVNNAGDAKALFLKLWAGEVLTTFDVENVAQRLHMSRSRGCSPWTAIAGGLQPRATAYQSGRSRSHTGRCWRSVMTSTR